MYLWDWGRSGVRDCAGLGWVVDSVQWRKLDSAGMVKMRGFGDSPWMTSDAACRDVFLTMALESSVIDPKWFVQVGDRITGG